MSSLRNRREAYLLMAIALLAVLPHLIRKVAFDRLPPVAIVSAVAAEIVPAEDQPPEAGTPLSEPGEPGAPLPEAAEAEAAAHDPGGAELETEAIDINRATAEELTRLPGIGPVLAARIVAYRERMGPFAAVEDLMEVDGIGRVRFERIRALVVVGPPVDPSP